MEGERKRWRGRDRGGRRIVIALLYCNPSCVFYLPNTLSSTVVLLVDIILPA